MRLLTVAVVCLAVAVCGCKKKPPKPAADPVAEKKDEPKVDNRNTNFRADGSTIGNAYRAGKRTVAIHDMSQLGTLITAMQLETGRMPDAAAIKAAMKTDAPNLHKAIDEGVIILTGTTTHGSLWAYEVDADKAGGIVLVGGTASRATAAEVKQHLSQK